ncbi:MAG: formate dehydrogenase accessory sulfurtransferase FdhD, partial [Deltaproteobacteria bacterium]|nr:formate dehydrogenase accessory sulfurtransferase FdhD [Deltaproteobacteria bacterium]
MLESTSHNTLIFENNTLVTTNKELILEEPLSLRIDGSPYAVVMRTPGDEIYHAAGFFLSEGLVNHKDNFTTLGYCTEEGVNV